jgi:hypothetical protein
MIGNVIVEKSSERERDKDEMMVGSNKKHYISEGVER